MERHQWRHEAERVAHERHTPRGHLTSEAISGHQRPSEAISGHQRQSEVIRGNQRHTPRRHLAQAAREAIRGPQRLLEVISTLPRRRARPSQMGSEAALQRM